MLLMMKGMKGMQGSRTSTETPVAESHESCNQEEQLPQLRARLSQIEAERQTLTSQVAALEATEDGDEMSAVMIPSTSKTP